MIRIGFAKIPYAGEQGLFSAEQGIKVPCSAENRDYLAADNAAYSMLYAAGGGRKDQKNQRVKKWVVGQFEFRLPTLCCRSRSAMNGQEARESSLRLKA
jgi:hypothetical protein